MTDKTKTDQPASDGFDVEAEAMAMAEAVNGGSWNDPKYYGEPQKEGWRLKVKWAHTRYNAALAERVKVKPLEWVTSGTGNIHISFCGSGYLIRETAHGNEDTFKFTLNGAPNAYDKTPIFYTLEAAKLAAFTHHEAAVRSALEVG